MNFASLAKARSQGSRRISDKMSDRRRSDAHPLLRGIFSLSTSRQILCHASSFFERLNSLYTYRLQSTIKLVQINDKYTTDRIIEETKRRYLCDLYYLILSSRKFVASKLSSIDRLVTAF